MSLEILFENDRRVACRKEPGLLSEDDPRRPSLPALLREHTGGDIFPIHRLDKETGGVMIYAKTSREAAMLSKLVQENALKKEYLAVLSGVPEHPAGTWEDLLYHDRGKNKTYAVSRERRGVKKARLDYRVLAARDGFSLVQIRLHTGRTHQIRAQSAARRLPLAGDRRYGGPAADALGLWAFRLTVPGCPVLTALPPAEGVWSRFAPELSAPLSPME